MKKIFKIVKIFLIIIVLMVASVLIIMTRGMSGVQSTAIENVPINMKDGTYVGDFNGGRWTNQVEVIIRDHKIADIQILEDIKYPMGDIADVLFERVIQEQKITVDYVSGATVTSKAYLKSIENALL